MSDVDDEKQAWWSSMKDAGADKFKQFKADIAAAPQIPFGVEIHNQADEWRITALEAENAQLRTERDGARAVMAKEAAEELEKKGVPLSWSESPYEQGHGFGLIGAAKELLALADMPAGYVAVKVEPSNGLLCSMAMRSDHEFGLLPPNHKVAILSDMRKIYEEVVGSGFYSESRENDYSVMYPKDSQ